MASAKTVEKTMEILQLISKNPNGMTLTEIYKALDLPKVTVYDILKRLYQQEAVYYRDYHLKKYAIGPKMFSIGQAFANTTNFIDPVKHDLESYAQKYKLTVFASNRMKDQIVYTYKAMGPEIRLKTDGIGVQIPVCECPDGKCYLAFEDKKTDEELKDYILNTFYKGKVNEEYELLMKVVLDARGRGYIYDAGITENFVFALAFPIYDFDERMVGVISSCRIHRLVDSDELNNEINELKIISEKVSHLLGYKLK